MINEVEERGKIIKYLEDALAISEKIEDGTTCCSIEEALDEARARLFVPRSAAIRNAAMNVYCRAPSSHCAEH